MHKLASGVYGQTFTSDLVPTTASEVLVWITKFNFSELGEWHIDVDNKAFTWNADASAGLWENVKDLAY